MTKIAKALAVLVTFISLAFMGFAAVSTAGGTNWYRERDKLVEDFAFTAPADGSSNWSVKARDPNDDWSKSSKILADLVISAQKHVNDQIEAEIEEVTEEIGDENAGLVHRKNEAIRLQAIDIEAIKKRGKELEEEIDALAQQIDKTSQDGIQVALDAQKVRDEAARRREDVFRLQNQIQEIQADHYQLKEQKRRLQDLLERLNGNLERLQRRNKQLSYDG